MEKNNKTSKITFWKVSDTILEVSTVIALFGILFLMALQIVMRYFFNNPLQWTDEISRMCMVWMTFLGSVIAFREGAHISVDLITNSLPQKAGRILLNITDILTLAFLLLLAFLGFKYVKMNYKTVSLVTGIRKGVSYSIIPISALWMAIYLMRNFYNRIRGGDNK